MKEINVYKDQSRLSILLILWRLPGFAIAFAAALASESIVVWLDVVETASVLIPGFLLMYISISLKKDLKYRFNYGTGKIEAITAMSCEIFDVAGLSCAVYFAIKEIIHPNQSEKYVAGVFFILLAGVIIDSFLLYKQKKLYETVENRMLHTALLSAQKEFIFDLIALVTLFLSFLFRKNTYIAYFSPVVCLVIAIPLIVVLLRHLSSAIMELSDVTLDEEYQMKILKMLTEFYLEYDELGEVRSRKSGDKIFVDIEMSFPRDKSYGEIIDICQKIKSRMCELLGDCQTEIIIF